MHKGSNKKGGVRQKIQKLITGEDCYLEMKSREIFKCIIVFLKEIKEKV